MDASSYALVHGVKRTRAAPSAWNTLFLPLAAWIIASRRGEWERLLAATLVTVALAVPVLVVSAL